MDEEEGADAVDQGVGEEGVDLEDYRGVSGKHYKDTKKDKGAGIAIDGGVHEDGADKEKARKEDGHDGCRRNISLNLAVGNTLIKSKLV